MGFGVQDAKSGFWSSGCKERVHDFRMRRLSSLGQDEKSSWVQDAKSEFMGSGCKE